MSGTRTFKIGDKVRRISCEFGGMKVGDTSVVFYLDDICQMVGLKPLGCITLRK